MLCRISDLIAETARLTPEAPALAYGTETLSYAALASAIQDVAKGLVELGLERNDRVAVYLEKRFETILGLFGAAAAGGVFVPVNPQLKPQQVCHILRDCGVGVLITSKARFATLRESLTNCPDVAACIIVDGAEGATNGTSDQTPRQVGWSDLLRDGAESDKSLHPAILSDMAAILYTSGSTGLPKGVVLSHQNLIVGAQSVASYLGNGPSDRILSLLPLSFDAGLSQTTTAFAVGAKLVLMNYLLPSDVVRICTREGITGITGVPPLWIKLVELKWPEETAKRLRYFANTGGHLPRPLLQKLRARFPDAQPFLMYGLTEAFRSTFLDPALVDERPDSIGKAIPNAEILVLRSDGSACDSNEPGELVHRGPLVAMGYWNDPERSARRFRPLPQRSQALPGSEFAVWSGDTVRKDEDGFLYFVGRSDEMIKTSGYRVSPTEIEDVAYRSGLVEAAIALGVPDETLGQAIVLVVSAGEEASVDIEALTAMYHKDLPRFMVPVKVIQRDNLPRNPNGKFDRSAILAKATQIYLESER